MQTPSIRILGGKKQCRPRMFGLWVKKKCRLRRFGFWAGKQKCRLRRFGNRLNSQLKKGKPEISKERFKLLPIYFIGILDFQLFNDSDYIRKANLRDEKCNKIDETLNFTFIEIPKFNIENPKNDVEKMLYFLKNSERIQKRIFRDSPFDDIFNSSNKAFVSLSSLEIINKSLNSFGLIFLCCSKKTLQFFVVLIKTTYLAPSIIVVII